MHYVGEGELMGSCPKKKEEHLHMKKRQIQRLARPSKAEDWAGRRLEESKIKWSRERIWRWRIYDFWNDALGCAVEIDGPEHSVAYDEMRDRDDYLRSGIIILRVRNFNESDMNAVLAAVEKLDPWIVRRERMGLLTTAQRRKISPRTTSL